MRSPLVRLRGHLLDRLDRREQDDRGAIAIMTGILAVVLLVVAALSVDVGNAWAVRGLLQKQVDEAALFAADALPVKLTGTTAATTQKAVAMRVAYYFSCDTVRGQRVADASIPNPGTGQVSCNGDTTQTGLSTYATKLISTGMVSFPTTTSVTVLGAASQVDFGFGPIANSRSVGEQKTATAQIYSPGSAAPIALGLQCTLSAAGTAPLGVGDLATGAVPLNYIAAGPLNSSAAAEPAVAVTKANMPNGNANAVLQSVALNSQTQGSALALTVQIAWGTLLGTNVPTTLSLHFYRGSENYSSPDVPLTVLGLATLVQVPTQVSNEAGVWYVEADFKAKPLIGAAVSYTTGIASTLTYTVKPPAGTTSLTACANLIDSPRRDTSNTVVTGETMRRNIKSGMDHTLTAHTALATLSPPGSVSPGSILNTLNNSPSILDCAGTPGSVLDNDATKISPLANCVNIASDGARQDEFTQGFLADPSGSFRGRLFCDVAATCSHGAPFTIPGLPGTYNNDSIAAYQNPGSILNSPLFFGLSTYLTDNIPAVTPPSTALSSDIYSSPRFMWTAVASRSTASLACSTCPVLTFRPIFITQSTPTGITPLDELTTQLTNLTGSLFNTILPALFPFLAPSVTATDHGIMMDNSTVGNPKLRALRFQTIEPTALPVPPLNYNGPVSDYLGTGPKVVRLVK